MKKRISFLLAEIHDFTSEEAQQLLHNKFVVVIGDSNFRAIYKDLVFLLQKDGFVPVEKLKEKHEPTFENDCLVESKPSRSNDYRVVRQYRTRHHLVRFYFITRVYSSYMESILNDFKAGLKTDLVPDVVIVHSCLWDLNRYQEAFPTEPPVPKAIQEYRQNAEKLFQALDEVLPSSTLIIWTTALSITKDARGYIVKQPYSATARDLIEANFYSNHLAREFWFDVLDLHYHFRFLEDLHTTDGIHWNVKAHRYITKLLLNHIAQAWQVELSQQRLQISVSKYLEAESPQPSPWKSLDPAPPPLIPNLWTNGSARHFYSERPSHLPHNAWCKKRVRGSFGQGYQGTGQFVGNPLSVLQPEHNTDLPDPKNSPSGLDIRPISSSEGPQPTQGYYPPVSEREGYDRWPIGSSEQSNCPQSNPQFDFHASNFAGPISGQEYVPQADSGYSWVPDSIGGDNRPVHYLKPDRRVQSFPNPYIPPFQDGRLSNFAERGARFHPNCPPHFQQGVGDTGGPVSIGKQEQGCQPHNYFQAAQGPGNDRGFPEQAQRPPLDPRRNLPAHHDARNGPWSTDGDERDPGFPHQKEEIHPNDFSGSEFFPHEEGRAPYSRPRRIPRGAWDGSRKIRSRRSYDRRQDCAPYATSWKSSWDPY